MRTVRLEDTQDHHTHIYIKFILCIAKGRHKVRLLNTRRPLRGRPVRMAQFIGHLRGVSSTNKKKLSNKKVAIAVPLAVRTLGYT